MRARSCLLVALAVTAALSAREGECARFDVTTGGLFTWTRFDIPDSCTSLNLDGAGMRDADIEMLLSQAYILSTLFSGAPSHLAPGPAAPAPAGP